MCDVAERAQWLDILIALIQYLRSGKNKVRYLNSSHERNMLHKGVEEQADQADVILAADQPAEAQDVGQEHQDDSKDATERETGEGVSPCVQLGSADGEPAVPLRRSARNEPQDRALKVRARSRKR
jgi:hypothetical protein